MYVIPGKDSSHATTAQCLYNDLSLFMKIKAILLTFSLDFFCGSVCFIYLTSSRFSTVQIFSYSNDLNDICVSSAS